MKSVLHLTCFAAFLLASPLGAQTYNCALKDGRNSGWTPDKLMFEIVDGAKTARTYDPITYSIKGEMAEANIATANSVRVSLGWKSGRYQNPNARPSRDFAGTGALPITFHATLLRGGNKILLRASPGGLNTFFSAKGACVETSTRLEQLIDP